MSEINKKVDVGLDIGIASVGWAITNIEDLSIEEYGVRLFPTVDGEKDSKLKNESRREARGARRQINRRITLRRDFLKLLIKYGFVKNIKVDEKEKFLKEFIENSQLKSKWQLEYKTPYIFGIRKEALQNKISNQKLVAILYWYINHRGFKYEVAGSEEQKDLEKNKDLKDENKLPLDNQIEYFQKNGYLNGTYNRMFHSKEYEKEINQIFTKQKLDANFVFDFLKLFKRQRSFEEGPGNKKTPTQYGRYYELKKIENNNFQIVKRKNELDNIWDATVGKCTFFPNENRAPKESFTSEIFNLLNQLNNISISSTGEVLSSDNKISIIKDISLKYNSSSKKILEKLLEIFDLAKDDAKSISGIPKDKKEVLKFTHLETYHKLIKFLPEKFSGYDYIIKNNVINEDNIFDRIIDIFSKNKSIEKRAEIMNKNLSSLISSDTIDKLSKLNLKASNTHSLSYYAMRKMIPDLIRESKMNQMQWAHNNDIEFGNNVDYGTTYLKSDWIEEIIATPSVKRAFRQTTKVVNAILELAKARNYEIRSFIIEMARETKNKDAKDQEANRQKYFETKRGQIKGFIEKIEGSSFKVSKHTIEKLWLLEQQQGHDAYTNKTIEAEDVINNPGKYDIDHIVPYSQSFSNNRSNKVLTFQQTNQFKTNKTPKQFLKNHEFEMMKPIWASWYKNPFNKVFKDYDKFEYLTSNVDYSKPENQLGFIQRNLVDTRYTTKAILNALMSFAKNDVNDYSFNVKTINGKMTSFARSKISIKRDKKGREIERLKRPNGLELFELDKTANKKIKDLAIKPIYKKSRIWHGHHAEDAYIITLLNSQYNDSKALEKALSSVNKYDTKRENKIEEDINFNNDYPALMEKFDIGRKALNNKMNEIKFSRMVEKKTNTKLFNETLYKGKINDFGKIDKYSYKNILDEGFKAHEFFGNDPKNKEKLLIYKHNRKLYDALNQIYLNYKKGNENPFKIAAEEEKLNKYIKVSYKNKKGSKVFVNVKRLNYIDQKGQKGKDPLRIVQAKNNKNSFYESMDWINIQVYKNKNDKFKIIPVDASNHIFKNIDGNIKLIPKMDILNKQKEAKDIDKNTLPCSVFYKGDIIMLPNNEGLVYVSGHSESQDKIEIKFLHRNKLEDEKQLHKSINKFLLGAKLVKLNILGTKIKEKFSF